ncbi:MAG: glycosyltransferase [Pseudomonadota bacterium]
MRIAFYAPMKPPDHTIPSGDRTMARALMLAIRQAGHDVRIASRLISLEKTGTPALQRRIIERAEQEIDRILASWHERLAWKPDIWLTYHHYFKAPDLLGPPIARAMGIAWVVAEAGETNPARWHQKASSANAPCDWHLFHDAVRNGLGQASGVINLNPDDKHALLPILPPSINLLDLRPFLPLVPRLNPKKAKTARRRLHQRLQIKKGQPVMLAVAMMRQGAKARSWRRLSKAMRQLSAPGLRSGTQPVLLAVGDGPERCQLMRAFAGSRRTLFLGQLNRQELDRFYHHADLFIWPAIDEAYGMAILEAQARGLAVVAARRAGVQRITMHPVTARLVQEDSHFPFVRAIRDVLICQRWRSAAHRRAMQRVRLLHSNAYASRRLSAFMQQCADRMKALHQ